MSLAYNPLLTLDIVKKLDVLILRHLSKDPEVAFAVSSWDYRVVDAFPKGWAKRRIGHSLSLYMDLRKDQWAIEHRKGRKNTTKYLVSVKPSSGQRELPDGDKRIHGSDFARVKQAIDSMLAAGGGAVSVSVRLLEERLAGELLTSPGNRNALLRVFLGLHPEYRVQATHKKCYDPVRQSKEVTFQISKSDHTVSAEKGVEATC